MDVDAERAQHLSGLTGGRPTASLEEAIEESDILWVCTPPKSHRTQVIACLAAGKHVYREKPIATTLEDGRAIEAQAEASGALAAIGLNFRLHEPWRKLRELLQAGEFGKVMMFFCERLGLGATSGRRRDPEQLCEITIESLSHNFDIMRSLLGDVDTVPAHVTVDPEQPEFDICVVAALQLRSGVSAGLHATGASPVPTTRHGVVGTTATVLVEGPSQFEFDSLRLCRKGEESERVHRFPLPANQHKLPASISSPRSARRQPRDPHRRWAAGAGGVHRYARIRSPGWCRRKGQRRHVSPHWGRPSGGSPSPTPQALAGLVWRPGPALVPPRALRIDPAYRSSEAIGIRSSPLPFSRG